MLSSAMREMQHQYSLSRLEQINHAIYAIIFLIDSISFEIQLSDSYTRIYFS